MKSWRADKRSEGVSAGGSGSEAGERTGERPTQDHHCPETRRPGRTEVNDRPNEATDGANGRTQAHLARAWWDNLHEEQSSALEQVPQTWVPWAIFLASTAALFVEMVMVRWHASCFHAFAIFKNVSLLSCFLGLGIGYGLSGRRRVALAFFFPLLALQALLFGILSCTRLGGRIMNPVAEQVVMGIAAERWSWLHAVEGNVFLLAVFCINACMFIPLGHLVGRLMARLPRVQSYSVNLLGSLAGIGLFFVLSLLWTGPEIWMGVAALLVAPFVSGRRLTAVVTGCVGLILVALGVITASRGLTYYSPYQVITWYLPDPEKSRSPPPCA